MAPTHKSAARQRSDRALSRRGLLPRHASMARRILVIGGGYAGALFANRLARKTRADETEIVLVNARPWFVERVRLHEMIGGRRPARRALATIIDGGRVRLKIGL